MNNKKMKTTPKTWNRSVQPRKQRKWLAQLPLHLRNRIMSSLLTKELRKKLQRRNVAVRKGDKVKVLRGQDKGKIGSVLRVDTKKHRLFVEGLELERRNGMKVQYSIHPSKVMITELHEDKKRFKRRGYEEKR